MPSKLILTVRVEYVFVFCTYHPSFFPILKFVIMLTTCVIVDAVDLIKLIKNIWYILHLSVVVVTCM